jgi:predicted phage terminase large subunit-like protein
VLPAEISDQEAQEARFHALRGLARTRPKTAIEAAEAVFAYGEYVFGYVPAIHHRQMVIEALEAIFRREPIVILEPRGAAKSTWLTTILPSWLIAMYPDLRVGMISNTQLQAEAFSRAIKSTYEDNERHRELFGDCVSPKKWTDKQWLHRDSRWHGSKDVTLFAVGVGGAIISKRFDVIIADDILDEENTANVDQREKITTWWWKTLTPTLAPGGAQVVIGTRWSEDDHYERLTKDKDKGGKGWRVLIQKALLGDAETGWTSYWPDYWSVDELLGLMEDMGTPLFSCAYQNDISGLLEGNIFKGPFDHFELLPEGHQYVLKMGVDLASSTKERADYTARVTTAEDVCPKLSGCLQRGHFFILSAYRDKRETAHAEFVSDGWQAYPNIELVIVESQQFQSTLIQTVMEDYSHIPIEGRSADQDKMTRARAVAAKFEAHRVHIHISLLGSALEIELLSFDKGHDDLVDALGYSMDLGGGTFSYVAARR